MKYKIANLGRIIVALLLSFSIVASMAAIMLLATQIRTAWMSTTEGTIEHTADGNTMDSFQTLLDLSKNSRYAGRLWADKSVFTGGLSLDSLTDGLNYNGIGLNGANEDFLHVFSALGSSQVINGENVLPLDVVFILDVSGSMMFAPNTIGAPATNYPNGSRIQYAVEALNQTIANLMQNNDNRVSVVAFSSMGYPHRTINSKQFGTTNKPNRQWLDFNGSGTYDKWTDNGDATVVLMPLDHYSAGTGGNYLQLDTTNYAYSSTEVSAGKPGLRKIYGVDYTTGTGSNEILLEREAGKVTAIAKNSKNQTLSEWVNVVGGTNTQMGFYEGMKQLTEQKNNNYFDSSGNKKDNTTQRIPVVIMISDGQPTTASKAVPDQNDQVYGNSESDRFWWRNNYTKGYNTWWAPKLEGGSSFIVTSLGGYDTGNTNMHTGQTGVGLASYSGTGMLAMMTASYMKQEITQKYFGNAAGGSSGLSTQVLTVGLDLDTLTGETGYNTAGDGWDPKPFAYAVLDPSTELYENHWTKVGNNNEDGLGNNPNVHTGFIRGKWQYNKNATNTANPFAEIINNKWNTYINGGTATINVGFMPGPESSDQTKAFSPNDQYITLKRPNEVGSSANDINTLAYNDKFLNISSSELLTELTGMIETVSGSAFIPVGGEGGNDLGGDGNHLTYMDPIGKYMEVKSVKNISLFGTLYTVEKDGGWKYYNANGTVANFNQYDYKRQYYKITKNTVTNANVNINANIINPCYELPEVNGKKPDSRTFKLSEIEIYLEDTGDYRDPHIADNAAIRSDAGEDQALFINIPVNALPIRLATIDLDSSGKVTSYKTNQDDPTQSTPLRVYYSVGMADEILTNGRVDLTKISTAYLNKHKKNDYEGYGKIYFYSNWYNEESMYGEYVTGDHTGEKNGYTFGDPLISFSPDASNRYYVFQKYLKLYRYSGTISSNTNLSSLSGVVTQGTGANAWSGKADNGTNINIRNDAVVNTVPTSADSNGYYWIVVDYYEPPNQGSTGGIVHRAVVRRGSEFGSFVDGADSGSYLCWYDFDNDTESDIPVNIGGSKPQGNNWVIATKPGGLRTGDMAQNVQSKGVNNTETAETYYLPTISANSGAESRDIKVNVYLGNNGLLTVNDSQLLVTKELTKNLLKNSTAKGEKFKYTIELPGVTGTFKAIVVNLDEDDNSETWRAKVDQIDLVTSNKGFLIGSDSNFVEVNQNGEVEKGGGYYVYIAGSENNVRKLYPYTDSSGNPSNDPLITEKDKDPTTGKERKNLTVNAYLIPIKDYNSDWSFSENATGIIEKTQFTVASVDLSNPIGYEVTSPYEVRTTYQTKEITFDKDGLAEFELMHGEGLLFIGLDPYINYKVTEKLTKAQIESGYSLYRATIETWQWEWKEEDKKWVHTHEPYLDSVFDKDGNNPDRNGGDDLGGTGYNVEFDDDEGEYTVPGRTYNETVTHIHYSNTLLRKLTASKEIVNAGNLLDKNQAFIFEVTLTLPEDFKPSINVDEDTGEAEYYFDYIGGVVEGISGVTKAPDGRLTVTKKEDEENVWVGTFTLSHGQTITILDLPYGTEYSIQEAEIDGYNPTTVNPATGTLAEDIEEKAAFKNTPYGALAIEKLVVGGASLEEFTFTVTFTPPEWAELADSYYYTGSKSGNLTLEKITDQDGTVRYQGIIKLAHRQSIVIEGLPPGTQYTVTENETSGFVQEQPDDWKGTIKIGKADPITVIYRNIMIYDMPEVGGPGVYMFRWAGIILLITSLLSACILFLRVPLRKRS